MRLSVQEQLMLMKAADNYAQSAVRLHIAKEKAKRLGDPVWRLEEARKRARSKYIAVIERLTTPPQGSTGTQG